MNEPNEPISLHFQPSLIERLRRSSRLLRMADCCAYLGGHCKSDWWDVIRFPNFTWSGMLIFLFG